MLLKEKITAKADWIAAKAQMEKDEITLSSTKVKRSSIIQVYQQRLSLFGAGSGVAQSVVRTRHIYPYINSRAVHTVHLNSVSVHIGYGDQGRASLVVIGV